MKTFCIVINDVLSIIINIQNTTIFEPVILTGFYTSSTEFIILLDILCLRHIMFTIECNSETRKGKSALPKQNEG